MVTWANLPQGNEVSSRLLGGNGGGRIRPRLTQAGRGISPRSLQPNPLPPPPPGRLRGTGAQRRESPGPPASPEAGVSFRPGFPAPTPQSGVQELPAVGRGRGAGRMSPHGKRAGSQAQGQPRPPPSTLRAPDRRACAPRAPRSPGARLLGTACGPGHPHAHPLGVPVPSSTPLRLVRHRKIPGPVPCVPSLLCPLRSRGSRVASPPAATLHNRGGDACPAAARGVTLHVARARAIGPPPASPSPPSVGPRPRGGGVPAGMGHLPACQELGRRCWRSAPGAGGKRETRKNYLSITLKS